MAAKMVSIDGLAEKELLASPQTPETPAVRPGPITRTVYGQEQVGGRTQVDSRAQVDGWARKGAGAEPRTPSTLNSQINARGAEIERRDIGDMGYVFANDSRMMAGADERSLEDGKELYRVFHNSPERRIIRRRCDRMMPSVLVDLGALRGLIYSADRDGRGRAKTFIHFMETPPRLMCDPQGNQLYVIGGRYRVTRRGIEG
jgi:hypothetical protein